MYINKKKILILDMRGDESMTNNEKKGKKSPIDVSNDNISYSKNEEFGLITVSHPDKNDSPKLSVEEAMKKMNNNQGGR